MAPCTGHLMYRSLLWLSLLIIGYSVAGLEQNHAADKAKPTVRVSDVLTTPGAPVQLQAHVFQESLLGRELPLGGERLEFLVEGQVVGTSMTGGDGWAFLEFAPRMRGNLTVTVQITESPRVLSAEGSGLLASWERKRPILLIDVAAIMQELNNPQQPIPSFPINLSLNALGEADKEAPKELEKLGQFYYNLMYVLRSEAVDKNVLQEWLQTHHFPPGFPKIIPSGPEALEELISKLKEDGWVNIAGGVGRTAEFAETLVEHRMKVVILHDPEDKEGFPRRAILVGSWTKVRKHL